MSMFRRYKKDEGAPNRLIDEAVPNALSWTSSDGPNASPGEPEDFEDEPEGEPEEGDELGRSGARTAEERAAALRAELEREAEEFGLTGSNPTQMYGPNGEDVASLLDELADIDDETAEAIADAYEAIPEAERKVARSVVRRSHRGGGREAELWAAEHAVSDWLASMQLEGDDAVYSIVAEAATDAVDALVLEDELADVDFDTLYGPWSEVMEDEEDEASEGDETDEAAPAAAPASHTEGGAEKEGRTEEEGEFGPNTALVLEFLTRLAALTAAETSGLIAAWRRQPKEELRIAHRNLQALADEDPRWREQLRLAQEEVFAWMSGRSEKRDYSFGAPQSLARVREPAGPAVADAVAALAMADMLEPGDAVILYAPWAEVVGVPELPEYEDDEDDGSV
ncbi:MAG: hypothetical protein ABSA21_01630 [Candidatus Limnocylindrales bacterium]|jgi:hypothetical protein